MLFDGEDDDIPSVERFPFSLGPIWDVVKSWMTTIIRLKWHPLSDLTRSLGIFDVG
mgnify:CR=1 FL=1